MFIGKVKPDYNHNDRNHTFIWEVLAHDLMEEDFEAIQSILINREDDHEAIDKATVVFHPFGEDTKMLQPRPVEDCQRERAHRYVDWSSALDIWLILSKYADFYSKK